MPVGRPAAAAQTLIRLALAAAVAVGCAVAAPAQPPAADPPIDDVPALPAQDSPRLDGIRWKAAGAAYRVPGTDNKIFVGTRDKKTGAVTGGVEDDRPLASEKQNPDESMAWGVVVIHAHQFAAADLEKHAAADLTPDDLTQPVRRHFRYELIRFDGTLTKLRRVTPTRSLAERDSAPAALYEGWLVPADESPANPVRVVFTTLPDGFPAPPPPAAGDPAGEWLAVGRWVTFAGFYFKLAVEADGSHRAPVLVGKSVTPLPGPPAETTEVKLPARYRVFRLVRDNAPIARDPNQWEEFAAWTRAVLHARKFDTAALDAAARTDLTFADLFQDGRADYQFELVKVKGRLIRVKRFDSSRRLAEAGVPACYEAWVIPENEPGGNPVCVILTELPEGVAPAASLRLQVTVAGYFFKLFQYESAEQRKDDPNRHVWKKAPLLIGRGVTIVPDAADGPREWIKWFIPVIVGGIVTLALTAFLLSRWFRAGDRAARAEFEAARVHNPFTE